MTEPLEKQLSGRWGDKGEQSERLASILGTTTRTFYRWQNGYGQPSPFQAMILELLDNPEESIEISSTRKENWKDELNRRQTIAAAALAGKTIIFKDN